ncbi:MAG TPA: M23 family metallopeptidase [Propionibacteriaceae bacterium]|nr:M23 family metallopeptidase [Propionibacteriaceae bacterium]
MPSSSSERTHARRVLVEDITDDKKSWLRHGVAALVVSILGLGVAGSVALTGAAQHTSWTATVATTDLAKHTSRGADTRGTERARLDPARIKSLADQREEELGKINAEVIEASMDRSAKAREKALQAISNATRRQAILIARGQAQRSDSQAPLANAGSSGSCLPIRGGYSIAAGFGQVGPWSRYHTGLDFSSPVGTPLHASAAGVVTNAGIGSASGWAGNYVAIKHADGTHTLLAHMSNVSVRVGQTVSACENVGAVGMTGRTFGAHVHFEVYPAGVEPGDIYSAVNPVPWLKAHGVSP